MAYSRLCNMGPLLCCPQGLNMEVMQLQIIKSMQLFRIGCPSPFRGIHFIATFENPKQGKIIFLLTANTLSVWALRRSRTSLHGYKTKRREAFPSGRSKASSPRSPAWSQVSAVLARHVCGRVCVTVHAAGVARWERKHRGPPQLSR